MKLPDGYDLYSVIDLKTNKKDNLFVTIGSVVIMAVMFIAAYFTKGVYILASVGWVKIIINIVIAFVGSVVYIFLHEATHAAFFKIFDTKCRLRFGFKAAMAYCASDGYYKKAPYLAVALSPVVIWTLLLLIPCLLVSLTYFWGVFFIQIFNISGAAGDLYVTVKILTAPKKALILDNGTDMEIYATDLTKMSASKITAKKSAMPENKDVSENPVAKSDQINAPVLKKENISAMADCNSLDVEKEKGGNSEKSENEKTEESLADNFSDSESEE